MCIEQFFFLFFSAAPIFLLISTIEKGMRNIENDNEDDSDIFKIRKLYLKIRLLLLFSEIHILYNSVIVLKHYLYLKCF